jgi:hypothetical protein
VCNPFTGAKAGGGDHATYCCGQTMFLSSLCSCSRSSPIPLCAIRGWCLSQRHCDGPLQSLLNATKMFCIPYRPQVSHHICIEPRHLALQMTFNGASCLVVLSVRRRCIIDRQSVAALHCVEAFDCYINLNTVRVGSNTTTTLSNHNMISYADPPRRATGHEKRKRGREELLLTDGAMPARSFSRAGAGRRGRARARAG